MTVTEGWTRSVLPSVGTDPATTTEQSPERWRRSAQALIDSLSVPRRSEHAAGGKPAASSGGALAAVLATLLRADIPVLVAPDLIESLRPAPPPAGGWTGSARSTEATAVTLYALSMLGQPAEPGTLLDLSGGTVTTAAGHDSPATGARLLDALGAAGDGRRYYEVAAARRRISTWLCDRQRPDGSWHDPRHASPYFTTANCVLALHDSGVGARASAAVLRAVDWVLRTQHPDGSWGLHHGTATETAYALQILLATTDPPSARMSRAAGHGAVHLTRAAATQVPAPRPEPELDPYRPVARAGIIVAGHLAQQTTAGDLPRQA